MEIIIAFTFIMGWAVGYFTDLVRQFFLEEEGYASL